MEPATNRQRLVDLLCRSVPTPSTVADEEVSPVLLCRLASGEDFTLGPKDAKRIETLGRVRSGEVVELELDVLAFSQVDGVSNANHVRFKPSMLTKLARSFKSVPFLRDHNQRELSARGGTVVKAKAEAVEGGKVFVMTIRVTAPWAVEAVLSGNLDRFSIGWAHGGYSTIECSACKDTVLECWHYPGQKLEDGQVVEFIFTEATGVELSGVNVPAVNGTGIDEIRSALSQAAKAYPTSKETDMDKKKLALALGLKEDADEQTILAAVQAQKSRGDALQQQLSTALAAQSEHEAQLAAVKSQVTKLEQEKKADQIDQLFRDNANRFPVTRDAKGELARSPLEQQLRTLAAGDFDSAKSILESLPVAVQTQAGASVRELQSSTPAPAGDPNPAIGMTPELQSQLKQMGISEEDFAKYNPLSGTKVSA